MKLLSGVMASSTEYTAVSTGDGDSGSRSPHIDSAADDKHLESVLAAAAATPPDAVATDTEQIEFAENLIREEKHDTSSAVTISMAGGGGVGTGSGSHTGDHKPLSAYVCDASVLVLVMYSSNLLCCVMMHSERIPKRRSARRAGSAIYRLR